MAILWMSIAIIMATPQTVKGASTGIHKQEISISENTPWYRTQLLEYPALRYEVDLKVSFPVKKCCPILCIFINLPEIYSLVRNDCLSSVVVEGMVYWYKQSTFILPNNTQNSGKCELEQGYYICEITLAMLNYEPKVRWLTLGYLCNQKKDLKGLQLKYNARVQNTTQCEIMRSPPKNFQCDKFYNRVAFPNLFGHRSQEEAFTFIQMFQTLSKSMDHSCFKYLDYIVCQAFLPRCPALSTMDSGNAVCSETKVSHLDVICEQTCWEFHFACYSTMQPILSFVNCNYYKRTSDLNVTCRYQPVYCDEPPLIPNGMVQIPSEIGDFDVGSTVTYSCNTDYQLQGNITSTCQLSGLWTPPPTCKNVIHLKIISASVSAAITAILGLVTSLVVYRTLRARRRRESYFENQPLEKRNKETDAFVSYCSDGQDHDFVKEILQPKLEIESDPPFKLTLHIRDFRADMLIYVNIIRAIKNSNSAIILMSQDYIDSAWCREEFQECMEENRIDPAYKLFVILMQPRETLKRCTAYMDKYFRSKTYLQKDDPQIWPKLAKYLAEVKGNIQDRQ